MKKYADKIKQLDGYSHQNIRFSHWFADWDEGGQDFRYNAGCYGDIAAQGDEEGDVLKQLFVYHVQTQYFSQEVYDWVMATENFGTMFLNTSLKDGLENGWELDLSKPYPLVLGAMICLRKSFNGLLENPYYSTLRTEGLSVQESLFASCFFYAYEDGVVDLVTYQGDHCIFGGDSSAKFLTSPPNLETFDPTPANIYTGLDEECFWDVWDAKGESFKKKIKDNFTNGVTTKQVVALVNKIKESI